MDENNFASESLHNQKQMDLQVQTGLRRTKGHLQGSFRSLRIFASTWTRLHRGRNLFSGTRFTQSYISIMASLDLELHQLDVKTAFS
jgi:hypothetical protein